MNAPGHQIVHQVVAAGYRVKNATHHTGLGIPIDLGEAKISTVLVAIRAPGGLVIHVSRSVVAPALCRRAGKCT
jgi:hypothetical protein